MSDETWWTPKLAIQEIDNCLIKNERGYYMDIALLWSFYRDDVKAIEYVEVKHPLLKELIANPSRDKVLEIIKQLKLIEINEIAETIKDNKYCWIDRINYRIY